MVEGRPLIMGIVNVTPDSFSDGGAFSDPSRAVAHALMLAAEGADIVDIGGESTRPGARAVAADEECRRVLTVIEQVAAQSDVAISIDTSKALVAREAVAAGAHIINDVSALTHDPEMVTVAAEGRAGLVVMHRRGSPGTMQENPRYDDVVATVRDYLAERVAAARAAGVLPEALAVDPGIGFGKTVAHNLQLLANVAGWRVPGIRTLVGLSRKRFIGALTGATVEDRLAGSLAGVVHGAMAGVDIMRVHDVAASLQAVRVVLAIEAERQ
ncbi:MAG: dihydropteroate synthase [Lentisphaerae bacterium]|nr:dihydropteroate synthase [Lentisphaerota bacterium]